MPDLTSELAVAVGYSRSAAATSLEFIMAAHFAIWLLLIPLEHLISSASRPSVFKARLAEFMKSFRSTMSHTTLSEIGQD